GTTLGAAGARHGVAFPTWARSRTIRGPFENPTTAARALDSGELKLMHCLPSDLFEQTLRHEMVHLLLWAATPFPRWTWFSIPRASDLLRFGQEVAAEAFMLLSYDHGLLTSLTRAVRYPFHEDYGISAWRTALEAAGAGTIAAMLGRWLHRPPPPPGAVPDAAPGAALAATSSSPACSTSSSTHRLTRPIRSASSPLSGSHSSR